MLNLTILEITKANKAMRPLLYSTIEVWKSLRADLPRAVLRGHHPEREKDERDPQGSGTHERSCSTTALMALDPRDLTDSRILGILSFHGLCYWWPAGWGADLNNIEGRVACRSLEDMLTFGCIWSKWLKEFQHGWIPAGLYMPWSSKTS